MPEGPRRAWGPSARALAPHRGHQILLLAGPGVPALAPAAWVMGTVRVQDRGQRPWPPPSTADTRYLQDGPPHDLSATAREGSARDGVHTNGQGTPFRKAAGPRFHPGL